MAHARLTVNGQIVEHVVEDRTLLVHFLRDTLRLTGAHVGCDTTQCGACTVLMNGVPVKSCTILVAAADDAAITTIEGISDGDTLHPMQQKFHERHALQCGFCTPGMVLAAIGLLERHHGEVDERLIREELEGNICRCTGYQNIVDAVLDAAREFRTVGKD
ncbi:MULTISPECIES: (2Fe-2S)-binding protein [unclassified Mesorhizobium]|uniref:(2Fe-2S)-binding protein n=1 Tax=unclassified Mesorhizobium TaxID=325217 RepID=UPI000FDBB9B6|nr:MULTISPECIES: (2Fe-2S)-binding protein [unclassified Mesorhizobium]TGR18803.1 (2Fe-2S)-binding protein [Mesorhizobium sp. M8A.F.Ca.ET.197.01.1.1]TGR37067.1 (2Fe-2S)-binding protein [bacterium M00.F.Ca.ET.199.01.1.1]TGR41595.1 (2Fe-2S)-binding protein [Mesorhizobium sp. M8A.F.Ca.ET.198.01.1.1]TGV85306.1 (2Fe-2S)-binding protein [Mesorhizobium sp. M00.F.Ca.ET.149.01.1.1]